MKANSANEMLVSHGAIDSPSTKDRAPAKPTEGSTRTTKRPRKESFTIAYRVDSAALLWLEERGAPYGMSAHEYARQRLTETIADTTTDEMRTEFTEVKRNLQELREDMAVTLEIILASLTDSDPARIRAWIDDNLRRAR